jgi:phage terminase large subunit GpA-like protein
MISFRQAAYYSKMKQFMISTPELKSLSNIEPAFLSGDQRYYHVPCPHCGSMIVLDWEIEIDEFEKAGITWELDNTGKLKPESVGFVCPECSNFFTDYYKQEMNENGEWRPTAEPSEPGFYSYHLNALYAPPGMFDWERYVRQYLKAYPPGGERDERKAQTFMNLVLGKTYEEEGEEPQANQLQRNTRKYEIGEIPESLSQKDGNGKIVLITCAADLNGKIDDARLDYEIVGWSENGASYSIDQGSIGKFIPREYELKEKVDRKKWTYNLGKENSVWPEFENIIGQVYHTDTDMRMRVFLSGIDAPGHFAQQAYSFLEQTEQNVIGLKGKNYDSYVAPDKDLPSFKKSQERSDLYLVEVNKLKDDLANKMKLDWDPRNDSKQPAGFMNFPTPSNEKYTYKDFFSHFESEWRVIRQKSNGGGVTMRWEKKNSAVQNHFWDVAVYNMALRDIMVWSLMKELKVKNYTWADYVNLILKK